MLWLKKGCFAIDDDDDGKLMYLNAARCTKY
jgi:hypothetical protein